MVINDKGKIRVFVYGTLKNGQINNIILKHARADFLGHDTISGNYDMVDLVGFPAVRHLKAENTKDKKIYGHLFCTDNAGLAALDHFEGHPRFFERHKIWTDRLNKRAWVYFLDKDRYVPNDANSIDSGIWNPTEAEIAFWSSEESRNKDNKNAAESKD